MLETKLHKLALRFTIENANQGKTGYHRRLFRRFLRSPHVFSTVVGSPLPDDLGCLILNFLRLRLE